MSEKGKRQQMNYDQKVLSEYEGKENGYAEEKFLNQENIMGNHRKTQRQNQRILDMSRKNWKIRTEKMSR